MGLTGGLKPAARLEGSFPQAQDIMQMSHIFHYISRRSFYTHCFQSKFNTAQAGIPNSGDTLLIYHLWAWLFGFQRSIEQPFQPFNEGIIAYRPTGSLMLSDKTHIRLLGINGQEFCPG